MLSPPLILAPPLLQLVELEAEGQGAQDAAPVGTPYWMAPEVSEEEGLIARSRRACTAAAPCRGAQPPNTP